MIPALNIGNCRVGPGEPSYIIAELSANHNGDFQQALALVEAAKEAGADAVKLQTYTADSMTLPSNAAPFRVDGTIWEGRTLYDLYEEAYMPWDWQPRLKEAAEQLGMALFSSPFDAAAVDFLEGMDAPAYKIASFENIDLPLIRRVAATGKPVIISTGMASLAEVDEAVRAAREAGCEELALLKCTSAYPAPPEEANLLTIPHLRDTFGVVAGLSDHTMSEAVPVAAVALGAKIIEKHFTLSRDEPGPDSAFSLEPHEFRAMVEAVRTAEQALGHVSYELTEKQRTSKRFRRSLFVVADVEEGEVLTQEHIRALRPALGLPPRELEEVLGRRAACAIKKGTPLDWSLVE